MHLTSDHHCQCMSSLWNNFIASLGISLQHMISYHPELDFHQTFKPAICSQLTGLDWKDQLPWTFLSLCFTPTEDQDASPADLIFHLKPPVMVHYPSPNTITFNISNVPSCLTLQTFQACIVILHMNACLSALLTTGPLRVIQPGAKTFSISVDSHSNAVSVDHLKPACLKLSANDNPLLPAWTTTATISQFAHPQNKSLLVIGGGNCVACPRFDVTSL